MSEWIVIVEQGYLFEKEGQVLVCHEEAGRRIRLEDLLPPAARCGEVGKFEIRVTFTPAKP